jgi:methanol metabolism-related c-type cytochrome
MTDGARPTRRSDAPQNPPVCGAASQICGAVLALCVIVYSTLPAAAAQATRHDDGRYYTETGEPTYHVAQDGRVDWPTFNGFRRYHAECHTCHGPNGDGSTFAPPLLTPLKTMDYKTFAEIIVHGLRTIGPTQQRVMRAMGEDRNVMCHLPDIYIYLKARADGALGRSRPDHHEPKPDAATQREAACLEPR